MNADKCRLEASSMPKATISSEPFMARPLGSALFNGPVDLTQTPAKGPFIISNHFI